MKARLGDAMAMALFDENTTTDPTGLLVSRRPGLRSTAPLALAAAIALLVGGCAEGAASDEAAGTLDDAVAIASNTAPPATATLPQAPATNQDQGLTQSRSNAIVTAASLVSPAVVSVHVIRTEVGRTSFWDMFPQARRVSGLGSGFIVDSDGTIITNDHVVAGAERIKVSLQDGRDFDAVVVGSDPVTDLAVISIDGSDLPTAPIGSSRGLLIGEWAIAIGNPFGNLFSNTEATVTAGVISAVNRHILGGSEEEGYYLGMIQTDAAINPGNSGGPLVNASGEVIGVNSSIFSRSGGSDGLGFAIPIDRALRVAEDLVARGDVIRPWLGIEITAEEADEWGRSRGVVIARIADGSPADRAGLQVGSVLESANGRRLGTTLDYQSALLDLRPGENIDVQVEGRTVSVEATESPSAGAPRVTLVEGLVAVTVTEGIQIERGLGAAEGALLVEVAPQITRRLSMQEGDVLLAINRERIGSAEDAARVLGGLTGGSLSLVIERNGSTLNLTFR